VHTRDSPVAVVAVVVVVVAAAAPAGSGSVPCASWNKRHSSDDEEVLFWEDRSPLDGDRVSDMPPLVDVAVAVVVAVVVVVAAATAGSGSVPCASWNKRHSSDDEEVLFWEDRSPLDGDRVSDMSPLVDVAVAVAVDVVVVVVVAAAAAAAAAAATAFRLRPLCFVKQTFHNTFHDATGRIENFQIFY
jgi:hypothetical protein